MKLSDVTNKVIDLARRIRAYYDAENPKYHPNYPLITFEESDPPPPPEEKELSDFLGTLSHETICQLLLLNYLGRMEYRLDELATRFEELRGTYSHAEAARELMNEVPLADILVDALEELHNHKINVDKLPLRKVVGRKR